MIFHKYHGAGNDFIMLDQRRQVTLTRHDTEQIAHLCDRRFGIGADGLILLQTQAAHGHEMIYFNADGRESTMCGNGGRCFAAFAKHLGIAADQFHFLAIDGPHDARLPHALEVPGGEWVELQMIDVPAIELFEPQSFVLNTGSPHYVQFTQNLAEKDMVAIGRSIRYAPPFEAAGINVNLVEIQADQTTLHIRTYERGVEDETLACGTGVTAAALSFAALKGWSAGTYHIPVHALGGTLAVNFEITTAGLYHNIWLCGPAQKVFEGKI